MIRFPTLKPGKTRKKRRSSLRMMSDQTGLFCFGPETSQSFCGVLRTATGFRFQSLGFRISSSGFVEFFANQEKKKKDKRKDESRKNKVPGDSSPGVHSAQTSNSQGSGLATTFWVWVKGLPMTCVGHNTAVSTQGIRRPQACDLQILERSRLDGRACTCFWLIAWVLFVTA